MMANSPHEARERKKREKKAGQRAKKAKADSAPEKFAQQAEGLPEEGSDNCNKPMRQLLDGSERSKRQSPDDSKSHTPPDDDANGSGSLGSWESTLGGGCAEISPRAGHAFTHVPGEGSPREQGSPPLREYSMQHGFMDGGVGRQASGSSTGFGQGPDYADFYGPFPQETPKYSTDMFSSARSSMDQKDFADGLQSEDDILAELMGQGCDSPQDRYRGTDLPPPPRHSYWDHKKEQDHIEECDDTSPTRSGSRDAPKGAPLQKDEAAKKPLSELERLAFALRMEGNAYFKEQEYKLAQKKYMLALEALPDDLRLHGNLMATYVKMDLNKEAVGQALLAREAVDDGSDDGTLVLRTAAVACLMDIFWWEHMANWNLGNKIDALQSLQYVMQVAADLHCHNRFAIAVQRHRKLRLIVEADGSCPELTAAAREREQRGGDMAQRILNEQS